MHIDVYIYICVEYDTDVLTYIYIYMHMHIFAYWTSMVQHPWALRQVPVAGGMSHPCTATHRTDSPKGRHGAEATKQIGG